MTSASGYFEKIEQGNTDLIISLKPLNFCTSKDIFEKLSTGRDFLYLPLPYLTHIFLTGVACTHLTSQCSATNWGWVDSLQGLQSEKMQFTPG